MFVINNNNVIQVPYPIEALCYPWSIRVLVAISSVVKCQEYALANRAFLVGRWLVALDAGQEEGVGRAASRAAVGESLDHEGLLIEGEQLAGNAVVALLRSLGSGAIGKSLVGEISNEPFGAVSWLRVLRGIVSIVKGEVSNYVSEICPEFAAPDRYPLEVGHYALSRQGESDVGLKRVHNIYNWFFDFVIQFHHLRLCNCSEVLGLTYHLSCRTNH